MVGIDWRAAVAAHIVAGNFADIAAGIAPVTVCRTVSVSSTEM
jgi:hypothetical protein